MSFFNCFSCVLNNRLAGSGKWSTLNYLAVVFKELNCIPSLLVLSDVCRQYAFNLSYCCL